MESTGNITITDFDASSDKIGLDSTEFASFFPNGFDSGMFMTVDATTYDGSNGFGAGEKGLIYASSNGSTTGELWYDADGSDSGSGILLATVTEYDSGIEADNNLTDSAFIESTDFGLMI